MASARKIAKEAGVSIGTVSRVLNNKMGVSEDTRRRVMEVAQGLNYTLPKRLPLPMLAVTHIGLLAKPVSETSILANPFYADVYHGVEQACSDLDIHLAFNVMEIADERLRKLPTLLNDERIGGLITLGALPHSVVAALTRVIDAPCVMVDNWAPNTPWDSVMMDNTGGMSAVVAHLIAQGHQQIVFVAGPEHPSIVERQAGYEGAMHQHGLTPQIIETPDLGIPDGEAAAEMLIEVHSDATAVVCANDMQAIGVIRRFTQQGIAVPEQIAVTGFDDIQMASFIQPTLTTMHVDRVALGRLAVDLLLGRVNAPWRPAVRCTMSVSFVMRESTAGLTVDLHAAVG
ncbi:MAG: LacI family DNA-binding transcriptional regulator [Caldilinea sp.]